MAVKPVLHRGEFVRANNKKVGTDPTFSRRIFSLTNHIAKICFSLRVARKNSPSVRIRDVRLQLFQHSNCLIQVSDFNLTQTVVDLHGSMLKFCYFNRFSRTPIMFIAVAVICFLAYISSGSPLFNIFEKIIKM